MTLPERVDLLIVGAGTAGAALAARAASRGLCVLCVDRSALDGAGARWVNGVATTAFDEADVPRPTGEELRGDDAGFHLLAGHGPERLLMRGHGVLEVDMRLLVARLQDYAKEAGATLAGETEVRGFGDSEVHTTRGRVRAEHVVDASGLAGAKLLGPVPLERTDLCAAAQAVYAVRDAAGARAFLDAHGVAEGETLCFSGVAGGYSILNVGVHGDEVSLLTGSIPADGQPSGKSMLETFVAEQPWIGARRFGGHRAIPLGRPRDTLVRGRVALLGDTARQVFSAHGSGIGAGMVAARVLADTLADTGSLEAYPVRWMRAHGGLIAASDVFRRFSQTLPLEGLKRLMRSGLIDEASAAAGLAQRLPPLSLSRARSMGPALVRAGRDVLPLGGVAARIAGLMALYARYPKEAARRARWASRVARLHGAPIDPALEAPRVPSRESWSTSASSGS